MLLPGDSKQHTWHASPASQDINTHTLARHLPSPPEVPPLLVVDGLRNRAIKDLPTKRIYHVAERDEGNLLQGHAQQVVDLLLWGWGWGNQEAASWSSLSSALP